MSQHADYDNATAALVRVLAIMQRLRDPERGCAWDRAQTFDTIAPFTIEESYEVADAIARADFVDLRDELGDLLFQVVFHAQLAQEQGLFDFAAVAEALAAKLQRRHPHLFGDAAELSVAEVSVAWERAKAAERAARQPEAGALSGIPVGLPALMRAGKLSRRAARAGFDWDSVGAVLTKVREELQELEVEIAAAAPRARLEDEVGDLLFACANLARHLAVDAEAALQLAGRKFERRFDHVEQHLRGRGLSTRDVGAAELDTLWNEAKRILGEADG